MASPRRSLTACLAAIGLLIAGDSLAAAPGAPTGVLAIPGNARATIHLTPPASDGGFPITSYTVTAAPGGATASAPAWPIVVTGLANGTSYTFTATATNAAAATSPASTASSPVTPVLPTITPAVSAAESFSMALDAHGQVYAWGSDANGELGQGRKSIQVTPVQVPGLPSIQHVAVFDQVLAVDTTGQVWTWGDGICTHLRPRDNGNASKPARLVGATGFTKVAAGYCKSWGLKADQTVWSFTNAGFVQITELSGIVDIRSHGGHLLALRNDHTVWAVGPNNKGQLGQGTTTAVSGAVQVPGLANVVAISAGMDNSLALLADGSMRFWGELGPVPPSSPVTSPTPVTGLGGNAVAISTEFQGFAAARADGTVWKWSGTLTTPTQVTGMSGAAQVAYNAFQGPLFAIDVGGGVHASGNNYDGQLGQGNTNPVVGTVAVPGLASGVAMIDVGHFSAAVLALKSDGSVWFWGANPSGQRGDSAITGSSVPLAVPIPATITAIAAGYRYGLALDNTGHVWGWGDNSLSVLDTTRVSPSTPILVPGLSNLAKISTGGFSDIAFAKNDQTAWVSVQGNISQVPGLSNIVDVACGSGTYFFLRGDGVLFSYGYNLFGQLGDGTTTYRTTPAQMTTISGSVQKIVAGYFHNAALMTDGRVYVWGSTNGAQSFTGGTNLPVLVTGITDAVDIAVSHSGGILRRADGSLYGWGFFPGGGGPGMTTPYPIAFTQPVQGFAVDLLNSYFIGQGGLLWGQGANGTATYASSVGDGTYVRRNTPVVALAHAGSGSLDGNNWFLDLQPATAESIPAASIPTALATSRASGTTNALGFEGTIKYKSADLGKRVNNYVLAVVPPAFFDQVTPAPGRSDMPALVAKAAKAGGFVLAQLTPAGWVDVNGQLIAYSQGTANASGGASNILNGINASLIPGSRFCVGYGESSQSMLSASALREVLLLEGTAATVSSVPCVLSGVYVDGPPASMQGSSVTFNASVIGLSPTGSVQFRDGFASLGSAGLAASNPAVGRASIATSSLAVGVHSVGASYSGDVQNVAASTAIPVLHVVSATATGSHTDLTGPASSLLSAEVIFTATVAGSAPTGSVQFRDGVTNLGAAVPLVDSTATLRTSALALGSHSVSAVYSGDGTNITSTSYALSHVVANAIGTRVTLTPSTASPKIGTLVTLTANVTGSSPGGNVQFQDGAATMASVPLASGQASFSTSLFAPGTHTLTARYSGDGSNPQATSPTLSLDVALAIDPAAANVDTDGDGIPNAAEQALGRNASLKDNDVFGDANLFSMQQYRDFLGREGDAPGIAYWAGQVSGNALSRGQVIESFFTSNEFQGTIAPVARLYFAYFLRIPEYEGINFWIGYYRAGNTLNAISDFFAQSAEFTARYGALDNASFVTLIYNNVLGRAPDAPGLAFWKGQLDTAAMTRGQVMLGFSESPEYRGTSDSMVYVTMMYIGTLRRAPEQQGFDSGVGYRNAGNPGLALIDLFLGSQEYHSRFLP